MPEAAVAADADPRGQDGPSRQGRRPPDPWEVRQARSSRFFALIWLVFLAYPLVDLLTPGKSGLQRVLGAAALAVFVATYVWGWSGRGGWHDPRVPWALGLVFALAVLTSALLGAAWVGLFIFAAPLAARLGSLRAAVAAVAINAAACAVAIAALHLGLTEVLTLGGLCGLTGVAMLGARRLAATATDLRTAREEVARLAAVEERLRIARDVHDLLGHSLSVIALKADLARRLLPGEADRAAAEVADIQALARRSLAEVREAVAGYRRLRLDEELARARSGLEAAGVCCAFSQTAGDLSAPAEQALAWVVREAATNVLRHSGAHTCHIRVARAPAGVALSVEDDGRGPGDPPGGGTGLAGLAERVRGMGGHLSAGPRDPGGPPAGAVGGSGARPGRALAGLQRGFRVDAWVPDPGAGPGAGGADEGEPNEG